MSMLSLLLAAALQSAPIPPAYMATRPNLDFALVTGGLDETFATRLERLLAANPKVRRVEFESLGGLASSAYDGARLLNKRGIEVVVRGRCASACGLLWAASDNRTLGHGARIGLHSGLLREGPPRLLRGAIRRHHEQRKVEVLTRAGFPQSMIAAALATPPESMLWFTAEELAKAGVRFRVVPKRILGPETPGPNLSKHGSESTFPRYRRAPSSAHENQVHNRIEGRNPRDN